MNRGDRHNLLYFIGEFKQTQSDSKSCLLSMRCRSMFCMKISSYKKYWHSLASNFVATMVLLRITSNYTVCSFCPGGRFSGVRGVGLRLVPVLRRFHVAGLLGLFGLSQAVLGPVCERGFPLPELDASLAKIRHEIRHRSDGHPRRDRFRQR